MQGKTYRRDSGLRPWIVYLVAACLYAGIAVLFTYPQIRNLTTAFAESPIGSSSDQNIVMWDAWWAKKSLIDLKTSPFSTRYLFYPNNPSLALHELTLLNSILTIPFQMLLDKPKGLILGCNIAILLTFVTAGVGMFALVKNLVGNSIIAFFGGIAFAFCPYRTMHIVHTDLLSMGWIPLYMLFLLRTQREKSFLNPVLAAVFFCAALLSCSVYTYFLLLLTVVFLLYTLMFDRKLILTPEALYRFLLLFLLVGAALLPRFIAILQSGAAVQQSEWTLDIFSANPVGYLLPTDKHLFYRFVFGLMPSFKYYLSGVPGHATFLTYTVVSLAVIAVLKFPLKTIGFWLAFFVVFAVLSLGPSLHFWKWTTSIPLPYLLLYKFAPFFNVIRTPYRFVVLAEVGIIVLSCYGLKHILNKAQGEKHLGGQRWSVFGRPGVVQHGIAAGFIFLLLLELWNIPFHKSVVPVPSIYKEIYQEKGEFAVLDLPASGHSALNRYMYYQTLHEKPIPTGVLSRVNPALEQFVKDLLPNSSSPAALDEGEVEKLKRNGIKYVIYHQYDGGDDDIYFVLKLF